MRAADKMGIEVRTRLRNPFRSWPSHQRMVRKFHPSSSSHHFPPLLIAALAWRIRSMAQFVLRRFAHLKNYIILHCENNYAVVYLAYRVITNLRLLEISARIISLTRPAQELAIVGSYWQVQGPVMGITHKVTPLPTV